MGFKAKISFNPKPIEKQLTERFGEGSDAQYEWSRIVFDGSQKYMPMVTGTFINQSNILSEPLFEHGELLYPAPAAHYLWEGVVYVDKETGSAWAQEGTTKEKLNPEQELVYNKGANPLACARWTEKAAADNRPAWEKEMQGLIGAGKV